MTVEQMVARVDQTNFVQIIRLKNNQFCEVLMCYVRESLKEGWLVGEGKG